MKPSSIALIILTVLVLNACKSRSVDYSEIAEFETVKKIELEKHSVDLLLGQPLEILIMNDMVIILDEQNDRLFHALSIDDFSHLGSFIRKGRGPGEEATVPQLIKTYGGDKILYHTYSGLKSAKMIKSDDAIDLVIHETYDLPDSLNMGLDFFMIDDHIFNSMSHLPIAKDYLVFNRKTGEVSEWGAPYPLSDDNRVEKGWVYAISGKLTTVNEKEKLIASVYMSLPLLRIYCVENERLIAERQMADFSKNLGIFSVGQSPPEGSRMVGYYGNIKSTDDYIYSLYAGFDCWELYEGGDEFQLFDCAKEIHIWKWDGTPVMKLIFDRPVFAFDVTPDNKRIIATSVVDVENLFVAETPGISYNSQPDPQPRLSTIYRGNSAMALSLPYQPFVAEDKPPLAECFCPSGVHPRERHFHH